MGSSLLSTLLLLLVGALLAWLTANRLKGLALPAINLVLRQLLLKKPLIMQTIDGTRPLKLQVAPTQ